MIPRQIPSEADAEALEEMMYWLSFGMVFTATTAIIISYALGMSLNMLWGLVDTQLLLLYLPMLQHVKFPSNYGTF